jgi:tRNA(fMet)-specific endonuclease VapC
VPAGPLLVDTDVLSWLMIGNGRAAEFAPLVEGHVLAVSFATVGEVLALGHIKGWGDRKIEETLRRTLRHYVVLPYTQAVVEAWAPLHAKLRGHLAGQGTNDLWTAACALTAEPRLPIVTGNLSDFRTIAGVRTDLRLVHPEL